MECLAITALSGKTENIYTRITEIATDMECFITQAQGLALASENAFSALITGTWNNIARVETALNALSTANQITLIIKRTARSASEAQLLAYNVQVIAVDQVGTVYNVCNFFTSRSIHVNSVNSETYLSNVSGTPMLAIVLSIHLPAFTDIAELREQFLIFCDDLNVDGILEPDKR